MCLVNDLVDHVRNFLERVLLGAVQFKCLTRRGIIVCNNFESLANINYLPTVSA